MRLITSFVTGFTAAALGWAVLAAPEPQVVEFTTAPTTTAMPTASPQALAAEYATGHGLTDCVDPARAFDAGADVVLTIAVDEMLVPTTDVVVPVTLDEALQSGEHSRLNVVACSKTGA